jgi:phosphate transport system ATP-binding protein
MDVYHETASADAWRGLAGALQVETLGRPSDHAPAAVLSVRNVSAAYGERLVLRNVSCDMTENQITAIIGPSGCGKSTLLRVLNRTLELFPQAAVLEGTISFRGKDLYGSEQHPVTVRRRIGLIHQRPVPFPMSILDDVLFGARYHRLLNGIPPAEYARFYLEQTGLWNEIKDRLRDRGDRLSGGQQQRLCLARALANQPEVILMDEPCSSLDPAATRQIEELILGLKQSYPIVIVTHNLGQAKRVADSAVFMLGGEIIESGAQDQIFARPKCRLTWDFVSGRMG